MSRKYILRVQNNFGTDAKYSFLNVLDRAWRADASERLATRLSYEDALCEAQRLSVIWPSVRVVRAALSLEENVILRGSCIRYRRAVQHSIDKWKELSREEFEKSLSNVGSHLVSQRCERRIRGYLRAIARAERILQKLDNIERRRDQLL